MSSDKTREEFEIYATAMGWGNCLGRNGENYSDYLVNRMWCIWQASRAAIAVKLPSVEYFGDYWSGDYAIKKEDVVEAIEAAGIKVAE